MSDKRLYLGFRLAFPGFDLEIDQTVSLGGVTTLFGPSGAGKTTLLRAIAGFERPVEGRIAVGDDVWFDSSRDVNLPPHKRAAGYMFQDARLFPHLTVEGNLRYAERRSRANGDFFSFDDIVQRLSLNSLLDRRVAALSGGEKQRTALARTLLSRPSLLLLDEPLAALDRRRKREILPFLDELPETFGIPVLFVSHDIDEICRLSRNMLVLKEGRAAAYGPTLDLVNSANLKPIADQYEPGALLEGIVVSHDERLRLTRLRVGDELISLPMNDRLPTGAVTRLHIHAKDVAISTSLPRGLSMRNILEGTIVRIRPDEGSAYADIEIAIASGVLRSRVTRAAVEELRLAAGSHVYALIKSAAFEEHEPAAASNRKEMSERPMVAGGGLGRWRPLILAVTLPMRKLSPAL